MADVHECLMQIRALSEAPRRLVRLLETVPGERWRHRPDLSSWAPVEIAAHLADAELFFATRIRLVLCGERPRLEPFDQVRLAERAAYRSWAPALAVSRFAARREDTAELLATVTGDEMDRVGVHAARGEVTVADLVAGMLAHDTAHLARIAHLLDAVAGSRDAGDT